MPHDHAVVAIGGVCPSANRVDRHPCAQAQGGWLCSQLHCDLPAAPSTPAPHSTAVASTSGDGAAAAQRSAADAARAVSGSGAGGPGARGAAGGAAWFAGGGNCLLARHGALLVEYDAAMRAPIGVVFMGIGMRCLRATPPLGCCVPAYSLPALDSSALVTHQVRYLQPMPINHLQRVSSLFQVMLRRDGSSMMHAFSWPLLLSWEQCESLPSRAA